jgi:hypothetical protein
MKTRRFDFNFKPLQLNIAISVDGSVPDKQNYDGDADEFTPDYTITPLILQPQVSRLDKDEIVSPGNINTLLTNIKWYQIIGGVRTQILAANTDYEMTTSGGQAGRIKVKKNAQPDIPITLEFYAEYVDSRTNQVIVIHATHIVKCGNATAFIPELFLDAADQTIFNPLIDPDSQAVHASLRVGAAECATANRQFVWEVLRSNNTWSTAGSDNSDYWLSISNDGTTCTVNRKLMGAQQIIRCRAKYDPNGSPGSVTLGDSAPSAVVAFVRRLPKYEYDIAGLPDNIPPGLLMVYPEVAIWDVNGPVENPQNVLLPVWYIGTNRNTGTPASYAAVAHGFAPAISTAAMSELYGAVIGVEVKDPGPLVPWADYGGGVFKDADGKVLLIK